MMPELLIARSCWNDVVTELVRVAPAEAVLVPLVAAHLREGVNPCAMLQLSDVRAFVVAHVIAVPPSMQQNTRTFVSVLPDTDAWLAQQLEGVLRRYPSLRAAAYLHSHPFARHSTWPSGGDVTGHMIPLWKRNREAGLDLSLSFIACRKDGGLWRLQTFAMDRRGQVIALPDSSVVDDDHTDVLRARATNASRRGVLRRIRRSAGRAGWRHSVDELMGGWVRVTLRKPGSPIVVALLPCGIGQFDEARPMWFSVDERTGEVRTDVDGAIAA